MSYTVTNGTTPAEVLDMEVSESTNEIDECQILTYGKYADNSTLVISNEIPSTVFTGYQTGVEQNDNYNVTYKTTVREKAIEMQYVILTGTGGETAFVKSGTASNLIAWALGQVNTAYGYSGASAWTVDSGSSSSTSLTIGCYYTNALAFIKKVVVDNLGYKLWFDSVNKKVYFRSYNTDRTATPIAYIDKQEIRDSTRRGCNRVIVIGKNASITGTAGSGNLIRVFEYPSAATTTECETLATKILSDVGITNVQYTVTLEDAAICNVADYINLDGTNYVVTKKVTTFDKIVITTGALTTSILDTLGNSITEVSGETVTGSDASWSGGNTNVAANGASITEFIFDVKDKNMISNAMLSATIGSFIKAANVNASTSYLSDIAVTTSNAGRADVTAPTGSIYIPSSSGITSGIMANGFQFGLWSFSCYIALESAGTLYVYLQRKYGSGSWTDIDSVPVTVSNTGFHNVSLSMLFPGDDTAESSGTRAYYRVLISGSGLDVKSIDNYMAVSRSPRHIHTVTTTYDKTSGSGTPPSSVTCRVELSTPFTLNSTPVDITNLLVTGKNRIWIATPSGTDNQCSVNPTITYQTLGKS